MSKQSLLEMIQMFTVLLIKKFDIEKIKILKPLNKLSRVGCHVR